MSVCIIIIHSAFAIIRIPHHHHQPFPVIIAQHHAITIIIIIIIVISDMPPRPCLPSCCHSAALHYP